MAHSLVFAFQAEDQIRGGVAPLKGSRAIYRDRHPLEREAEQGSAGWSMAVPARIENDAVKENLKGSSSGKDVYARRGSHDACVMILDVGRLPQYCLGDSVVERVKMGSEIVHQSDDDDCDRLESDAGDALEKENRGCAVFGVGHIHFLMIDSVGAAEAESGIFEARFSCVVDDRLDFESDSASVG